MKIIIALFLFACAVDAAQFKNYTMDNMYFTCKYPQGFKIERDKEKDIKNSIYKVVFSNPKDNTSITIKYYGEKSGKDYKSFIENQSKTGDGKLESATEKYEKVKEIKLLNRDAFEIDRKLKEFESIEAKSSSYWLKERIIVLPAKKGFYALIFSSKEENFDKYSDIFDKVIKSLKVRY